MIGKDTRRGDKFNKTKQRFKSGKYKPRTAKDKIAPRTRPTEDNKQRGGNRGTDRRGLKRIAGETIRIIEDGQYEIKSHDPLTDSVVHNIKPLIRVAKKGTITYQPETLPIAHVGENYIVPCQIIIIKDTTLGAARAMVKDDNGNENGKNNNNNNIAILNFASAKNPGGGFLKGSNAQEESIARSSALYECIRSSNMYEHNQRDNIGCMYSHHMIYSPSVPVFRDNNNDLIPPYCVSVLTVPAVNTKQALIKGADQELIDRTMIQRMDNLMSVAMDQGTERLVLGAWGCGVFGGDFNNISQQFLTLIRDKYLHSFKCIVFALLSDRDIETIEKNIEHMM